MPGHVPGPVHAVLHDLCSGLRSTLRGSLAGIYLFGSVVAGDFDPETSDLDLLVAVSSDVDDGTLERLRELHARLIVAQPAWQDRIDANYLSVAALRQLKHRDDPIVVITPGEPIHRTRTSAGWLMNWHNVRDTGVALLGPSPRDLIAETTPEDFVAAVRVHMRGMLAQVECSSAPALQAYAVLTACRALYTCSTGGQASKKAAAQWAERRHPEWASLIRTSLAWRSETRRGRPTREESNPQALEFVRFAAGEVAETRTRS